MAAPAETSQSNDRSGPGALENIDHVAVGSQMDGRTCFTWRRRWPVPASFGRKEASEFAKASGPMFRIHRASVFTTLRFSYCAKTRFVVGIGILL